MLGILILFSFWVAITIIIVIALILTFACGSFLAEKMKLEGFGYYLFMVLFYLMVICLLIIV